MFKVLVPLVEYNLGFPNMEDKHTNIATTAWEVNGEVYELKDVVNSWDLQWWLLKLVEEMSELSSEIVATVTKSEDNWDIKAISEELAQVEVILDALKKHKDYGTVTNKEDYCDRKERFLEKLRKDVERYEYTPARSFKS